MHHKRRRPANRRAGCKLCKPWKINHAPVGHDPVAIKRLRDGDRHCPPGQEG